MPFTPAGSSGPGGETAAAPPQATAPARPPSGDAAPSPVPAPGDAAPSPGPRVSFTGGISDPGVVVTPVALSPPPVGGSVVDPVFGTAIRRLTNATASGSFGTHIYSQLQAFSPDNAYILLYDSDETVVRRLSDLAVMITDTAGWNAPRWHPARPHTLIYYDSNDDTTLRVLTTDAVTGQATVVFTFPAPYERIRPNQSFDELSREGRWMAGMASVSGGDQVIFALDLQTLSLPVELSLSALYAGPCEPDPDWGEVEPDWIAASPLGRYLVVGWARDGIDRCSGLESFDLTTGAFVGRAYDGHQHGDLGVDTDGTTEFYMTFELAAPPPNNDRPAIGMRSLPGTATASEPVFLQVMDWGMMQHISCQGPQGVCLVTGDVDLGNGWAALEGELFLQYTDGSVLRLAHYRSSSCGYWVQPRASFSSDGRYVVFASDWWQGAGNNSCAGGNDLGAGEAYLIDLGAPVIPPASAWLYLPAMVNNP